MEVFRLSRKKWANMLTGHGAALKGGRWNSPGTEIIYTSCNRSLAMAEVAVHFSLATLPDDYRMVTIYIPEEIPIKAIPEKNLPYGWNSFPYGNAIKNHGDEFIRKNKYCLLKVPSAITKGDHNILINPFHPDFKYVKITHNDPFPLDRRILK
ncbi:MAG: RES family NAD+ phosphorylase [Bacteroidota bacterium]